jgi:hypothetical protein
VPLPYFRLLLRANFEFGSFMSFHVIKRHFMSLSVTFVIGLIMSFMSFCVNRRHFMSLSVKFVIGKIMSLNSFHVLKRHFMSLVSIYFFSHFMLFHVTSIYFLSFHVISCHFTSYHDIKRHIMSLSVISCDMMCHWNFPKKLTKRSGRGMGMVKYVFPGLWQ